MVARYYSSSLGRFMAVDPASRSSSPLNPQTWNRYTYALNNPISYFDPDGEAAQLFISNRTTGSSRRSFDVQNVAGGVQQKFDATGGDVKVNIGSPGLWDYVKGFFTGDSIHRVTIVNEGGANENQATLETLGHSAGSGEGGDPVSPHTHADNHLSDDPDTPGNEREQELANTTAHEFGHGLGLGRNSNPTPDLMTDPTPEDGKPLQFNKDDAKKIREATK